MIDPEITGKYKEFIKEHQTARNIHNNDQLRKFLKELADYMKEVQRAVRGTYEREGTEKKRDARNKMTSAVRDKFSLGKSTKTVIELKKKN